MLLVVTPEPEFKSRGGPTPLVQVRCIADRGPTECAEGATLAVEMGAPADRPYAALFRLTPDGTVVWMKPGASESSAKVATLPASELLDEGYAWAGPSGTHRVYAVFSAQPLSRDARKEKLGTNLESPELTVVVRSLEGR